MYLSTIQDKLSVYNFARIPSIKFNLNYKFINVLNIIQCLMLENVHPPPTKRHIKCFHIKKIIYDMIHITLMYKTSNL